MSTTEMHATDEAVTETGARPYRVVDPLDATGRMTVETIEGDERTVVGCLDEFVNGRLADRTRGSTVRMELSSTPDGDGYVAARVLPGSLPAL